jgi:hypothetical protein
VITGEQLLLLRDRLWWEHPDCGHELAQHFMVKTRHHVYVTCEQEPSCRTSLDELLSTAQKYQAPSGDIMLVEIEYVPPQKVRVEMTRQQLYLVQQLFGEFHYEE